MKTLTLSYLDDLPFEFTEAVNELRINLSFARKDTKVVMVTSSLPNEGKSLLSLALWKSLASVGKRVLFIDCDLRMSSVRSTYNVQANGQFLGLTHVLSGQCDIDEALYKTNIQNGYMIPVSNDVIDPSALIEDESFGEIIHNCAEAFDYIVIDTPPLGSVADALTIGNYADGSILVVRSGYTSKSVVKESYDKLQTIGKPFLGFALNRIDMSKRSGSYYYRNASNYYYGYGNRK